jgi:HK97 family phage major capsid protein
MTVVDFPALKTAKGKLEQKTNELASIFREAGPDYDMDKVKSLSGDSAAKVEEIRVRNEELNGLQTEVARLKGLAAAADRVKELEGSSEKGADEDHEEKTRGSSKDRGPVDVASAFVKSDAFKSFRAGMSQGPVSRLDIDLKTLMTTTANGWPPESTRSGVVTYFATRPAPDVVDFIPQIPTKQAAYKYMEETTFTNAAVETSEGGTFPESALTLTERSQTIRKIPTFVPVTDEQLEDEEEAEAYVRSRLVFMLRQRIDLQVIGGDGSAPNILGTENVSGIQTQALSTDPIPDAVFKLFRKIRDNGFAEPSVLFIQPSKWETVRLMRTADGIYIWGSPAEAGPERMWGVPVKQTTAVTSTKAIAGDYPTHSALVVRRGVDVQVSNSHSTYFIEGKQAVRADVRVAMVHYRPKAFGAVTGL